MAADNGEHLEASKGKQRQKHLVSVPLAGRNSSLVPRSDQRDHRLTSLPRENIGGCKNLDSHCYD